MTTARLAAARVLVAVERGRTTLAAEVDAARGGVAVKDRGLLLELAAGTLRWQNELDACLQVVSERPLARLEPDVRAVLRLGVYQLRHLDRVPVHAVVHEAVETVKRLGQARASGFVNAVLRSLSRRGEIPLPPRPTDETNHAAVMAYLSVTLSHPEWLAARWLSRYGFAATERWCQFNNTPPDLTVRPLRQADDGDGLLAELRAESIDARPATFVRGASVLPAGSLGRLDAAQRDLLAVQEEASQIVAHAVLVQPGDRVLDLCAAPGGKTAMLSAAMRGDGLLVASDHRPGRVALLGSTLRRAGVDAAVLALDATRPLPFGPVFDRVLIDAPCSGLGIVRRDPDLKWSRRPDDLQRFADAQIEMLSHAAGVVRPGGRLIYATCSSEPEENDLVVDRFLSQQSGFTLVRTNPGPAVDHGDTLIDDRGFLRTLPHQHGLDAFFAATVIKNSP